MGVEQRFWSKVDVTGECWEWTGYRNAGGYGSFRLDGRRSSSNRKMTLAHRAAWILEHGFIPEGLDVLHSCDNRACVRLNHLSLGDDFDNCRDRVTRGRSASKLSAEQIPEILRRCAEGERLRSIAEDFDVTPGLVSQIKRRKIWAHVRTGP